jgi:hypothetical protein
MQKEPIETLKVAILCVFEPLILHTETEKMMPKKKKIGDLETPRNWLEFGRNFRMIK